MAASMCDMMHDTVSDFLDRNNVFVFIFTVQIATKTSNNDDKRINAKC